MGIRTIIITMRVKVGMAISTGITITTTVFTIGP